jgi:hypothetical protein
MKNRLKTIALVLLVGFSACDDYVEVEPIGPDADAYFNNQAEYENALIGAYDLLQTSFWNVLTSVVASDDYAAGGDTFTRDQPTLQNINEMGHTPLDENQLRDIFNLMNAGIQRTNYLLEFKNKTVFEGRDNIIAQTYFLRAYYTFELAKFYGNVPLKVEERNGVKRIVDSRIVIGEEFEVNRTQDIAEVYGLIEEDLKEAILSLNPTQDAAFKATKAAAQALLGKVYLYHGTFDSTKFADAAMMLNNVIGQYTLTTGQDYLDLFESRMENSSESVFEIQYSGVLGGSWDCVTCGTGTLFPQYVGPRPPYDSQVFGTGFGFCLPSLELYGMFDENDARREVSFFDLRDAQDSYSQGRDDTGLFNKKYMVRKVDPRLGNDVMNHGNNYRSIRYADVLLMAAEAEAQSGGVNAQNYLNQVRARAFGNNSNDYTSGEGDLLEAIYTERRKELAGEGHRFFDLVRTNKAVERITGFETGKNEVFPIPLIELQLAGATERWGNQGYE